LSLNRHILRSISFTPKLTNPDKFPFNLQILKNTLNLELKSSVTFLVGENGSGKSTFLEALACKVGSITIGSSGINNDKTLDEVRPLTDSLKLIWQKKTKNGFFLRAEDFFGYTKQLTSIKAQLKTDL